MTSAIITAGNCSGVHFGLVVVAVVVAVGVMVGTRVASAVQFIPTKSGNGRSARRTLPRRPERPRDVVRTVPGSEGGVRRRGRGAHRGRFQQLPLPAPAAPAAPPPVPDPRRGFDGLNGGPRGLEGGGEGGDVVDGQTEGGDLGQLLVL